MNNFKGAFESNYITINYGGNIIKIPPRNFITMDKDGTVKLWIIIPTDKINNKEMDFWSTAHPMDNPITIGKMDIMSGNWKNSLQRIDDLIVTDEKNL